MTTTPIDPHAHGRGSKWPAVDHPDDDTGGLTDDCAPTLLADARHRTQPGRRGGFIGRLIDLGVGRRTTPVVPLSAVTYEPTDEAPDDRDVSEWLALATEEAETVHDGKGVHDATTAYDANRDAGLTGPGAVILDISRPRKERCRSGCGRPAPYRDHARPDMAWCAFCKPSGLHVVIGNGPGVA